MAKVTRTGGPGMKQLEVALAGLGNKQTKVGYQESAKYPDGTPVAYVAAIQEFGDPSHSIPPRPFMRPTVARDTPKWRTIAESGAKAIVKGSQTTETVMEALGQLAASGVRTSISQVYNPPLSPTTLRLRKLKREGVVIGGKVVGQAHKYANSADADLSGVSTKPLVFDGILLGSVTSATENVK